MTDTPTLQKPLTSAEKVNILMVDDSPDKLMAMESILMSLGQNLVKVNSGIDALRMLLKQEFAVILLDVNMPGMDGFETMRMVRQLRPLIPIIVISGKPVSPEPGSAPDFLTMATKLGAISSLQKPFKPAALLAAVERSLAAARRPSPAS